MKSFSLVSFLIVSLGSLSMASASSKALNPDIRFCDNITQIDPMVSRAHDSVDILKQEGLEVERIVVSKDRRQIYLISGETVLRSYPVAFGFDSQGGAKRFEGDGKTPEGLYFIDYKNPQSMYTKALHVSYPNTADVAFAKSKGKSPGGDIMIHGFPSEENYRQRVQYVHPNRDWTEGCVAVTNEQIADIYALVAEKTLVEICKLTPTAKK